MIQHVESHQRRSPGPGGRPGFSLLEMVMVLWIVGVLMAVAVPTFGGARERARARLTAGVVQQEIRHAGQLAYARGTMYTLAVGANMDSMILTPFGGAAETVIDFSDPAFDTKVLVSMLFPYAAELKFDSSGDVVSPVSWDLVSGSTSTTVVQEKGAADPVVSELTKATDTQIEATKLEAQL